MVIHMAATTTAPPKEWTPGPDLASRFRTIRRQYSFEVLELDKALNQEDFASIVGFGSKAWAAWETGRNRPDDIRQVADQLYRTIGLNPDFLTSEQDLAASRCTRAWGPTLFDWPAEPARPRFADAA